MHRGDLLPVHEGQLEVLLWMDGQVGEPRVDDIGAPQNQDPVGSLFGRGRFVCRPSRPGARDTQASGRIPTGDVIGRRRQTNELIILAERLVPCQQAHLSICLGCGPIRAVVAEGNCACERAGQVSQRTPLYPERAGAVGPN